MCPSVGATRLDTPTKVAGQSPNPLLFICQNSSKCLLSFPHSSNPRKNCIMHGSSCWTPSILLTPPAWGQQGYSPHRPSVSQPLWLFLHCCFCPLQMLTDQHIQWPFQWKWASLDSWTLVQFYFMCQNTEPLHFQIAAFTYLASLVQSMMPSQPSSASVHGCSNMLLSLSASCHFLNLKSGYLAITYNQKPRSQWSCHAFLKAWRIPDIRINADKEI
jgi:hypothetical protein